jgi:hypothetical protein
MARLRDLRGLLDHGSPEEQKALVQAFVHRIELSPKESTGTACFYRLPASSSFGLVAGARYERVQIEMKPGDRLIVRRRILAAA